MLPGHLDDGVCGNNLAAVLPSAEGTALFYRGRKYTVGHAEGHLFGFHGGTVGTGADGSTVESKQVTFGVTYGVLPTPVKEGSAFGGWEYSGQIITADTVVQMTGEHVLTATWN